MQRKNKKIKISREKIIATRKNEDLIKDNRRHDTNGKKNEKDNLFWGENTLKSADPKGKTTRRKNNRGISRPMLVKDFILKGKGGGRRENDLSDIGHPYNVRKTQRNNV